MKNALLLIIAIIFSSQIFAQSPQKMSYQAVIRNSSNTLVVSKNIGMQISVLQGSITGTAVYVERQFPSTNANGLVTIEIGTGTVVSGTFAGINWASGPFFIKTETDLNGGASYTISGTSELMSVPYALFAANSTPGPQGLQGIQGIQGIKGDTGARGLQGIQGIQGLKGDTGARGLQGIQGIQGLKGDTGMRGLNGDTAWLLAGNVISNKNIGNVGIGTNAPQAKLAIGANSQFQVDSIGNIKKINNVPTSFPSSQGTSGQVLTNNGVGLLSWSNAISAQKSGSVIMMDKYDTSLFSAGYSFESKILISGQKKLADSASWQWIDNIPLNGPKFSVSYNSKITPIYTGSEILFWDCYLDQTGAVSRVMRKLNPSTNTFSDISTFGAPSARLGYTKVWTGTELIVWGGDTLDANSSFQSTNEGYRYNPTTNIWTKMSTTGGPSAIRGFSAVCAGTELIIWGGSLGSTYFNNGYRYNSFANSWVAISSTGAPTARAGAISNWTGSTMIVWGGYNLSGDLYNGSKYNPSTNSWTAITNTNCPTNKREYTSLWTGTEMIIWGGLDTNSNYLNDGKRYNPVSNIWANMSTIGAPYFEGSNIFLIWSGTEMIIWGRQIDGGFKYNPVSNSWINMSTINNINSSKAGAVWVGNELFAFDIYGNFRKYNYSAPTLGDYINDYLFLFKKN